jgi:hypothetical protein
MGFAYMAGFLYFGVLKLNFTWLSSPNSPYPFAPEEMRRFGFPDGQTGSPHDSTDAVGTILRQKGRRGRC